MNAPPGGEYSSGKSSSSCSKFWKERSTPRVAAYSRTRRRASVHSWGVVACTSRTGRPAAAGVHLDRRAFYGAVRTEHATVAVLRTQHSSAALAVVEEDAGIGGHRLDGDVSALGTRER